MDETHREYVHVRICLHCVLRQGSYFSLKHAADNSLYKEEALVGRKRRKTQEHMCEEERQIHGVPAVGTEHKTSNKRSERLIARALTLSFYKTSATLPQSLAVSHSTLSISARVCASTTVEYLRSNQYPWILLSLVAI
ncbi:hypothetical protein CBL_09662 [Carabus blaptoides fortunei]